MHQVNQQALQQQHQSDVVLNARRLDGDVQKKPEVIKKEVYKLPEGVGLNEKGEAGFHSPKDLETYSLHDAWGTGIQDGYQAGKYVGFQKGSDEGLKLGNKQGYQLGDAHGYIKGFDVKNGESISGWSGYWGNYQ